MCRGPALETLRIDDYPIAYCWQCTHQFTVAPTTDSHATQQFGNDYFFGGGTSGYADYLSGGRLLRERGNAYAEIVSRYMPEFKEQHQLEIGCAAGFLMKGFEDAGWKSTGIDPNQTMVDHARTNGITAFRGTLESAETIQAIKEHQEQFDIVTMVQLVAHLYNLDLAMKHLAALVRDNGLVLVETWDSQSRTARFLRSRWHEYNPPNVLHFFSGKSLDRCMSNVGFHLVAHGRPDKPITVGHGRSLFDYKYGDAVWGKALLAVSGFVSDDVAVKYPSEDLFWRLYEKRR